MSAPEAVTATPPNSGSPPGVSRGDPGPPGAGDAFASLLDASQARTATAEGQDQSGAPSGDTTAPASQKPSGGNATDATSASAAAAASS